MTSPVLFQFLPPLALDEYTALEASIREHGVQVPIVVDENGVVIDGHHRQKIAEALGAHCPQTRVFDKTDAEKRTLALTLNLDRRNLNREQRRAIVEASVKADPDLSDLQHAKRTGVSDKTVTGVRRDLEQRSEIPNVTTRTDSLGRQHPATKPGRIDFTTGEVLTDQRGGIEPPSSSHDVEEQESGEGSPPAPRPAQVIGLDGKTYTRPAPKERRRSIVDSAQFAAADLLRAVERIERIYEDDRYPRNREQVAEVTRGYLSRSAELINRLITA